MGLLRPQISDNRVLRAEFERNQAFRRLALLFAQALSVQVTFSVACGARHRVDRRLARWLSAARDRAKSDSMPVSQEFLAMMLGCRRAGVTSAIAAFRAAGLIGSSVGRVSVVDRQGLRAAACSCYGSVRKEYEKLLR
ncbi:MAG: helix-turn-helix domain-containing protein [Alphaproteobacteria bacterium]|nr:helix-turn-helix domain-containing protein [Alphaproteobacteria bacterium]